MIKNIIFDLGNVIVAYTPLAHTRSFTADDGEAERLCRLIFESPAWRECDLGQLTRQAAIERLCREHPEDAGLIRRITHDCENRYLEASPDNMALVRKLRAAGFGVYYLSNINDPAIEVLTRRYDLFSLFMGGIASNLVHLAKPDPRIYRILLDTYGLVAAESLFIDDMPENVVAAQRLGFHAIRLDKIHRLYDALTNVPEVRAKLMP